MYHILLYYVFLYDILLHHILLYCIFPYDVLLYYIRLHDILLYHIRLHYILHGRRIRDLYLRAFTHLRCSRDFYLQAFPHLRCSRDLYFRSRFYRWYLLYRRFNDSRCTFLHCSAMTCCTILDRRCCIRHGLRVRCMNRLSPCYIARLYTVQIRSHVCFRLCFAALYTECHSARLQIHCPVGSRCLYIGSRYRYTRCRLDCSRCRYLYLRTITRLRCIRDLYSRSCAHLRSIRDCRCCILNIRYICSIARLYVVQIRSHVCFRLCFASLYTECHSACLQLDGPVYSRCRRNSTVQRIRYTHIRCPRIQCTHRRSLRFDMRGRRLHLRRLDTVHRIRIFIQ